MDALLKRFFWIGFVVFLVLATGIFLTSLAPREFPVGAVVTIPQGTTLSEAAEYLWSQGLIRNETLFKVYVTLMNRARTGIKTGEYFFGSSQPAYEIAYRLLAGIQGFPVAKVTVPEGSTVTDIAADILLAMPSTTFPAPDFIAAAMKSEGYLFPETYFWPVNVKPAQVISDMKAEFDRQIAKAAPDIARSKRSQSDIVKMAAILEREATSTSDRRIVAGILWKRLDAGMPLQVDAPFEYALHKSSANLTREDLAKDTPYNLYLHTGLGPTPIANPGLAAILDAANATTTKYWYYLSDSHGVLHYAATLDGHAANKNKYLK